MATLDETERSFPFAAGPGASVTQDDWAAMASSFQTNGVRDWPGGTSLTVRPGAVQDTIEVSPGEAVVDGFYYRLTAPKVLNVQPNTDLTTRTDLVSLHLDTAAMEIRAVITAGATIDDLPEGGVPLGEWTQLTTASETPTNWGSAVDRRWFITGHMRPALDGAEPPAQEGAFLYKRSATGQQGSVYLGESIAGSPQWVQWQPGKDYGKALWSNLVTKGSTVWVAHRGGSAVFPENTIESFRGSAGFAAGVVDAIELDVYKTKDGGLVVMHDSTMDRTSTLTGNNSSHTIASATTGRVDAGAWFANTWANTLLVPTFEDVLDAVGGSKQLVVHCNNAGSGAPAVDAIQRRGLESTVMIMAWNETELSVARNAGIPTVLLDADGILAVDGSHPSGTYAALLATGTEYLGVDYAQATDATITAAKAAGLKVIAYTVNRRRDLARLTGLGVWGVVSDDPWYVGSLVPKDTTDPWDAQTFYVGHLGGDVYDGINDTSQTTKMAIRGYFTSPDYCGVNATSAAVGGGYHGFLLGSLCPVSNPTAFTLNANLCYDSTDYASAWAGFFIGAANDAPYDDDTDPLGECDGYNVLLRANGAIDIYKVTHSGGVGTSTKLGGLATNTTAFVNGTPLAVRIQVTATQIIATRVDTGAAVTVTDSSYRGPYLHFGVRDSKARLNNVTIS